MNKVVKTKKLMKAIEVLGGERMADCSDEAFMAALLKGRITVAQIYRSMETMSFQWSHKRGYWMWRPRHLKNIQRLFAIVNKEDEPIVKRMLEEM